MPYVVTHTLSVLKQKGIGLKDIETMGGSIIHPGKPYAYAVFSEESKGFDRICKLSNIQFPPIRTGSCSMRKQGPAIWAALHIGALLISPEQFPVKVIEQIETIHCKECKADSQLYLQKRPIPATTHRENARWVYDFHAYVSQKPELQKPVPEFTASMEFWYQQAMEFAEKQHLPPPQRV